VIFLTSQIFGTEKAVQVVIEPAGDQEEDPIGPGNDIEPPPPLETDLEEEEIDEVIEAVADAMATRSAMLERSVSGEGTGQGGGGTGRGRKGPVRGWQLRFQEGETLETYTRQLDHFKIELAVLRPGNKTLLISKLSQIPPQTRLVSRDELKNRYRFTWRQGSLEAADRRLLQRANIDAGPGGIHKILPDELYRQLVIMEAQHASGKNPQTTVFGIMSEGSGYKFYVMRQTYRSG
ncbi:MAG: hypothetical protein GX621_10930, partial [Pirellulaceae bacterium]|nr:hypothetical protein [Pirellulaceae bacterium]